METQLDLKQMPLPEKLRLMEALWDELCTREEEIPVSDWHKALLDERERQLANNEAKFDDWETAKTRIRNRVK